jgi:hypothetical protein
MASPTCKAETGEEFSAVLELLIDQWKMHGEETYGPLWCVGTDGDSTFRGACHKVLMCNEISRSDPLFPLLSALPGLNLRCGKQNLVHSPDPKHTIKRIATLVRSKEGIFINKRVINRGYIQHFLHLLPGETEKSVELLIDPADHQNVPRAVKLIVAIESVSHQVPTEGMNPTDRDLHTMIGVIGSLFDSILQPFINPELSLSEQLEYLSEYAHLSFALYRKHGSSFMSNQLYGDLQALVKSAFILVAQQKLLDKTKSFYVYQLGQDRIEETFAEVRTESHDRNCDVVQLTDSLSAAADCIEIYNRHPEWNRGQRRISYTGREGVDHVNPRFFKRDLVVGNVNLSNVWRAGRCKAAEILSSNNIEFNFEKVLLEPGLDFMQPHGGGIYPGIATDKDRSLPDPLEPTSTSTTPESILSDCLIGKDHKSAVKPEADDDDTLYLEDFLDNPNDKGEVKTSHDISSDWIAWPTPEGSSKPVHKASILSTLFSSGFGKLATDRLLRVRGYTRDFKREADEADDIVLGEGTFQVRDIAACAIRTLDTVSIAVVLVFSIEKQGKQVSVVKTSELTDPKSEIQISGQVLVMKEIEIHRALDPVDREVLNGSTNQVDQGPLLRWIWTGEYAAFSPLTNVGQGKSKSDEGTRKSHVVRIPGRFAMPINTDVVALSSLPESPAKASLLSLTHNTTHSLRSELFKDAACNNFAYLNVEDYQSLTKYGASSLFPYRDQKG